LGGGYQIRMQSVRSSGLALAGTALNNGSASVFYNPGNLAFMENEHEFSVGSAGLFRRIDFQSLGSKALSEKNTSAAFPYYFYGAIRLNKNLVFGMGVYTPFVNSVRYADDWSGRLLVQSQSVNTVFYQPTIAFKFTDQLSLGAGLVYAKAHFNMKNGLPYGKASTLEMEGEASNIGYNLGLFFTPTDHIAIGMSYRSQVQLNVTDGRGVSHMPAVWNSILSGENTFSVSLPLPASFDYGMSFKIDESFLFTIEFNWVMWSIYESLDFRFQEQGTLFDSDNPRRYKDVLATRIGGEYMISETILVRAGAFFEPTPTDKYHFAADNVSLNTLGFTLGASIEPIQNLLIDFSYVHAVGLKSEMSYQQAGFSGSFSIHDFMPGIGISYRF
jgi:long-chain fatty acid transport protein